MNHDDPSHPVPNDPSKDRDLESLDTYFAFAGQEKPLEPEIIAPSKTEPGSFDIVIDDSWYREVKPNYRPIIISRTAVQAEPKLSWKLPLFLYLATWICVTLMGGILFALAVMTILTCHEFGHYIQTRRYRVAASLPYFIPFPSIFGTMGAIIRMDSRIPNTRALFDIGISGPLAGLVPTIIFGIIGIQYASIVPRSVIPTTEWTLEFNDPLLMQWLIAWIHGPISADQMVDKNSNSLFMASWFGLFLTSLNLFPIGQLDGGHVFYALLKRRAPMLSSFLFLVIIAYVFLSGNWVWTPMIVILYLMNPRHPPTQNDRMPIGSWRVILGWLTLAFIIAGFTLNPITEIPPTHQPQQNIQEDDEENTAITIAAIKKPEPEA